MTKIVILDYGMGNLRSVEKKVIQIGYKAVITSEIDLIKSADKLILPGVGHFQVGITKLKERNLIEILNRKIVEEKIPVLGICLGMQLFTSFSEEGESVGLGWLDAKTVRFSLNDVRHKVPHIGWNSIDKKKESLLLKNLPIDCQFYFVHSYHVKCNDDADVLATSRYGYEFVSAVQKDNIFGIQFHPEKSHESGEKLLLNFLEL
jgi:imidazole glycerol-phosphate synthase subunit HisH